MSKQQHSAHINGVRRSHLNLIEHLRVVADSTDPTRPSLLEGWTIGHLLTHVARNAASHTGMIRAALAGERPVQYPGGLEQRNGGIAEGAVRPMDALVDDVAETNAALEAAYDDATDDVWAQTGERLPGGERIDLVQLPFLRWRESEIHHSDCGLKGFTLEDWDGEYVREELRRQEMTWAARKPMGMTKLPPEAHNLQPRTRLAWLVGRITPGGLEPVTFP